MVSPRQLEQVLTWLENGGNLIVTANSIGGSDDLLLKEFNVGVTWRSRTDAAQDKDPEDNHQQEPRNEDDNPEGNGQSISESLRDYNRQIDEGKKPEEIELFARREYPLTIIDFSDDVGSLEIAFKPNTIFGC